MADISLIDALSYLLGYTSNGVPLSRIQEELLKHFKIDCSVEELTETLRNNPRLFSEADGGWKMLT